jgi:hypothetical protein
MANFLRELAEDEVKDGLEISANNLSGESTTIAISLSMVGTLLCSISFVWMKKAHN